MDTFCLVRTEHLSHQGYLFGGQLLKWVDEYTWIEAARECAGQILVTRAMDRVEFTKRVGNGATLRFNIRRTRLGRTSVTYRTRVYALDPQTTTEQPVFSTHVTFVAVDADGHKTSLRRRPRQTTSRRAAR